MDSKPFGPDKRRTVPMSRVTADMFRDSVAEAESINADVNAMMGEMMNMLRSFRVRISESRAVSVEEQESLALLASQISTAIQFYGSVLTTTVNVSGFHMMTTRGIPMKTTRVSSEG